MTVVLKNGTCIVQGTPSHAEVDVAGNLLLCDASGRCISAFSRGTWLCLLDPTVSAEDITTLMENEKPCTASA